MIVPLISAEIVLGYEDAGSYLHIADPSRPHYLIDLAEADAKTLSDFCGRVVYLCVAHWIKFSMGIPVILATRRAVFFPNLRFPVKNIERYCSVIWNCLARSARDKP